MATGYLAFRCLEGVATIALGGSVLATRSLVPNYEIMIYGFTGTAELRLSYLLYKVQLVPTWLSWLGIVGYIAIVAAIPTTLLNIAPLDSGVGICCTFRAASSSCSLPILLISRGFRRTDVTAAPLVPEGRLASA